MRVCLVLPHQLFERHPCLAGPSTVVLLEEQLFFGDWRYPARFHKQKLAFHRAGLRAYGEELRAAGHAVLYVEHAPSPGLDNLFAALDRLGAREVALADPTDFMVAKRLRRACARRGIGLTFAENPGFLCAPEDNRTFFDARTGPRALSQTAFYAEMRRRFGVLLENGKPLGGKWTFDTDNRKPWRGEPKPPRPRFPAPNAFIREAVDHVRARYPDNPGELDAEAFLWPVTRADARAALTDFLDHRLAHFGAFEDAMAPEGPAGPGEPFLFHSLLSPLLNAGLLTPGEVLDAALRRFEAGGIPLASIEGFVRQILGWREFMRAMYERVGVAQRNANGWGHARPLPRGMYDGTTGIAPVDAAVRSVLKRGWLHHIERLMVVGNFLMLCEVAPEAVYTWFAELFVDSHDWVMVPNVYGMSQQTCPEGASSIVTKPYVSASAYLLRMGGVNAWAKGSWQEVWDALFWRFVAKNRDRLAANPRMWTLTANLKRMGPDGIALRTRLADRYLETSLETSLETKWN